MYTIGQLVKQFKISRSTLLYYDKIGLLRPSDRTEANYRRYDQNAFDRLTQITLYKEAGLSLTAIADILDSTDNQPSKQLELRLASLNEEMSQLRQQQQFIIQLLGKDSLLQSAKVMNKAQWVQILKASGMDEAAMHQWHIAFEQALPEAHSDFLESLGISEEEIATIKAFE